MAPRQTSTGIGIAALSRLFSAPVRARGGQYVGRGLISVEVSTGVTLWGSVRGSQRYVTRYSKLGQRVLFACSCPYFGDRGAPCKHLYALALEQAGSELLRSQCSEFLPDLALLAETDPDHLTEVEADSEDEEVVWNEADGAYGRQGSDAVDEADEPAGDADADEEPDDGSQGADDADSLAEQATNEKLSGLISRLKYAAPPRGNWQNAVARVRARQDSRARASELLYFLSPSFAEQGTTVLIAVRKLGGPADAFAPVEYLSGAELSDAIDRELYGFLVAASRRHDHYYSARSAHLVPLSPFGAPLILERLARSERCYLVPADVRKSAAAREWSVLAQGERLGARARKDLGYAFDKLLTWPRLSLGGGEAYRLRLGFLEPSEDPAQNTRFTTTAELFRGNEQRALSEVPYSHPDGLAILGSELVRVHPQDAEWLGAIVGDGALGMVSEQELPNFVEHVLGDRGVSSLIFPQGYQRVALEPAQPVLDFEAPSGKKLRAHFAFDYGGRRVSPEQSAPVLLEGHSAFDRHLSSEREALALLGELGFTGELLGNARAAGVSIAERALPEAVRALLAAGWAVSAVGKRYRKAGTFEIEVESGIDWFEVKGVAHFDGGAVPFPQLLAAIKRRSSVVQLGDGSWGLLPEEWLSRWGILAELPAAKNGTLRFSSRQIGLVHALAAALPDDGAAARGLAQLREKLAVFDAVQPALAPRGFLGQLRPYQEQGLGWLTALGELGFGACLADDMGLGKTIQVLAYLLAAKHQGKKQPSLVVVPRTLLGNWLDEAARFAPELSIVQHWGPERRRSQEALADVDVVLTTYGTLRLDIALFSTVGFGCVVLDEAQAIKNKNSATAKCAKLLRAEQRIAMSGTPVENHLGELWSLFEFLNPGLLQELGGLRQALESPKPSLEVLQLVRTLVRPFVLRRTKGEVAKDLPERTEQTLLVELEPEERRAYDDLLRHYQASVSKKLAEGGAERATTHLLEALLRLRQAACHPGLLDEARRHDPSAKVDMLVERLRGLREEGHRALVFSQFTSLLAIVRERLDKEQITYEYLDGKTRDRKACVARFQSDPTISAFLISLKAGGVGLNLTGADYVFILDPWWNPAAEAQAVDRAHRIGQTRHVIAYRLLARGTVEERVAHLQAQKRELVAGILGDDQAFASRLTRTDFEALLSLTQSPPNNARSPAPSKKTKS